MNNELLNICLESFRTCEKQIVEYVFIEGIETIHNESCQIFSVEMKKR